MEELKENKFYNTNKEEVEQDVLAPFTNFIKLNYNVVDKSNLTFDEKRNILYSLYSFRCLFDNKELYRISKTLLKYDVSFITSNGDKDKEGVYQIKDKKTGKIVYKYDVYSPCFIRDLKNGKLKSSLPQKLTLYETALACVQIAPNLLKALWFAYFPYILVINAPVEHDILDALKSLLCSDKVFSTLIKTDEGDSVYVDIEDVPDDIPMLKDWYRPYIEWRREKPNGTARYNERILEHIKNAKFDVACSLCDAYLSAYPDDEDLVINTITARSALCASLTGKEREELLKKNRELIDDAISATIEKKAELLYFLGMNKLGFMDIEGASKAFAESLTINPNFTKSAIMLEGIKKAGEMSKQD